MRMSAIPTTVAVPNIATTLLDLLTATVAVATLSTNQIAGLATVRVFIQSYMSLIFLLLLCVCAS
jgi:hypothetical protein